MVDGSGSTKLSKYEQYKQETCDDIAETVQHMGCQPILFIGSGISKRYFSAPNWEELLSEIGHICPHIDKGFAYYKQSFKTMPRIGSEFSRHFQEWAWGTGKNQFDENMFLDEVGQQDYFKSKVAEFLVSITPNEVGDLREEHKNEISALMSIKPHSIITTNYDSLVEVLFPEHKTIVGQQMLTGAQIYMGEIFKIHGCVSDPKGMVITEEDYDKFDKSKKFLSAKLLTFFNEHPLIFIGYSANDANIQGILTDIDQALPQQGDIIPNIYILEWDPNLTENSSPARDRIIPTEGGRTVRVKLIRASDFTWVFDAFAANPVMKNVDPRLLRALIARSYTLVRRDIPRMKADADFATLEKAVKDDASFANLFGIAEFTDSTASTLQYPYSPTELGIALGGTGWHYANQLIEKIRADTGTDIRSFDNPYHHRVKQHNTYFRSYSKRAFELLQIVRDGKDYTLNLE